MTISHKAGIIMVLYAALLAGCQALNPYTTEQNGGSYRQGEKPGYSITQLTNTDGPSCAADKDNRDFNGHLVDANCRVFGKLTQTNPSSNISFQTFLYGKDGKPTGMVTCASPAEVAKAFNFQGDGSIGVPIGNTTLTTNASGARTVSNTVIQPPDAATQYVAAASFYNCLAFASGMIDAPTAAANLKNIFDNAVKLTQNQKQNTTEQKTPAK